MQNISPSKKQLLNMYYMMHKIRLFEEKLIELHPEQMMKCLQHYCIGQEAITTGVNSILNKGDKVLCSYRSHGHFIAKGGDINKLMIELHLKKDGISQGRGGSMHVSDTSIGFMGSYVIVGSYVPIAVGTALSLRLMKKSAVTVVFFGDGGLDEGVVYEAFNFAALKKLPIVFICENNGFASLSKDSERQANLNHNKKAESFGVPASQVDGQNVLDVYKCFKKAYIRAKEGKGPTFINAPTFRFKAHIGVGDDIGPGLRTKSELEAQKRKDPILIFRSYLSRKKLINNEDEKIALAKIKRSINASVVLAKRAPLPKSNDLLTGIFA